MKFGLRHCCCILVLGLLIGCDSSGPVLRSGSGEPFSGTVFLTLERAILWGSLKKDLIMELNCRKGVLENEVFGYRFDRKTLKDVFYGRIVHAAVSGDAVKVTVRMQTGFYQNKDAEDTFSLTLTKKAWTFSGTYTGTFGGLRAGSKESAVVVRDLARYLRLKLSAEQVKKLSRFSGGYAATFFYNLPFKRRPVTGAMEDFWPAPLENFERLQPEEHPRLLFRKRDVPALREKIKTPEGRLILSRLHGLLDAGPANYGDYSLGAPDSGHHAAGHCFLYALTGDVAEAAIARQMVERSMPLPTNRSKMLRRAPLTVGIAVAYDLCYDAWDGEFRVKTAKYLARKGMELIHGGGEGYNDWPQSNWYAITRGAAGVALSAVLGDPGSRREVILKWLKAAEFSVKQYLTVGIGDHGFGSEGEAYQLYALGEGVLPFFQTYQTSFGKIFTNRSRAAWLAPLFVMKTVYGADPFLVNYGPYGGPLSPWGRFAMMLGTASEEYKRALKWSFDRIFGMEGDKSFDIDSPLHAIFAFKNYSADILPENPAAVLPKTVQDRQKGYYLFRNGWKDEDDVLATFYLKSQPLRASHSFSDAGSFRICGLGEYWASQGKADPYGQENENIVLFPGAHNSGGAKTLFYETQPDGSGSVTADMSGAYRWQGPAVRPKDFRYLRSFAVDYSGLCGAPGLFVVVDKISGGGRREWRMHVSGRTRVSKNTFIIEGRSGATMRGTFIAPDGAGISVSNDGTLRAEGPGDFFVVMTVQREGPPEFRAAGSGLAATVTVGGRRISYDGEKIVFD